MKRLDWKSMPNGHEKRHAYYASREWAVLKESVRERSGGVCEHCRTAKGTQTHHQTYIRIYNERLDDLLHVCEPCHLFLSGKGSDPRLKPEQPKPSVDSQKRHWSYQGEYGWEPILYDDMLEERDENGGE